MSISRVASFRERQAEEEASARQGLTGFAVGAPHGAINARATRGAAQILRLVELGQHAQALALLRKRRTPFAKDRFGDSNGLFWDETNWIWA